MVATPSKQIQALSISAFGQARSTIEDAPLSAEELRKLHAFWRASNYLAVGMIYLRENPLLREPIKPEQIKQRWLSDRDFDSMFTPDKPIIFNFHGYPWLIHRLTYRRTNHNNIHVRGYKEKGNRVGLVFGREPDAI